METPIDLKLDASDVRILIRALSAPTNETPEEAALLAHLELRFALAERGTLVGVV